LASGQTTSALFTVTVNNSVMSGETLVSNATVEPSANDSNKNNNTATARVTVTAANAFLRGKTNGKIVFVGGGGAYSINPDGSGETPLPGIGSQPVWSPDGTKMAFLEPVPNPSRPEGYVIFVSDADGSNKVKVATNPVAVISAGSRGLPTE